MDSQAISVEVLKRMLEIQCKEALVPALLYEKKVRSQYGKAENVKPVKGTLSKRALQVNVPGRDIYGLEKSTEVRYFECPNCERQVAGHRFAAHIARCSGRGRR